VTERAEILGIAPQGVVSAGGTCRLLPARDGRWVALNLARRADTDLLAAWMGRAWDGAVWDVVAEHLLATDAEDAVERAQLLGVPAAVATDPPSEAATIRPVRMVREAAGRGRGEPVVVDLSALWAGPLCARLLGERGARVRKVEFAGRPDGARAGPPEFWDRLNGGKEDVVLDRSGSGSDGQGALGALLDDADVVVTAARPRAVAGLGLGLDRRVRDRGLVWVSITGYGFSGAWSDRVAFAGGLAVAAGGRDAPVFVGDAVADPLAGMHAAVAAIDCLEDGVGAVVDVSMRDCVGHALARAAATLA
jgi:crotonobetainyl-CoA:carnitine CoA-transferase CaiB-like acyl-CoA transferase